MCPRDSDLHPAYVLHARPYRESSLLLDLLVLGRGHVGAVVRSARNARSGGRRALLQPLQPLHVGLLKRGELSLVTQCEAASQPLVARGESLLAVLYLNELCQRLLPRDEPVDTFFLAYATCLAALAAGGPLADPLRRIESALLETIGYGLDPWLGTTRVPIEPEGRYWLEDSGALICVSADTRPSVSGAALRGLAGSGPLPASEAAGLRRLLRDRLRRALGPRPLRCWGLLDELSELRRGTADQSGAPANDSETQAASNT